MEFEKIHREAGEAMTRSVLRFVTEEIRELAPDTSAISPQHVVGFEAGFRECKRIMLGKLAE